MQRKTLDTHIHTHTQVQKKTNTGHTHRCRGKHWQVLKLVTRHFHVSFCIGNFSVAVINTMAKATYAARVYFELMVAEV